jgi:hypothetical protein
MSDAARNALMNKIAVADGDTKFKITDVFEHANGGTSRETCVIMADPKDGEIRLEPLSSLWDPDMYVLYKDEASADAAIKKLADEEEAAKRDAA